MSNRERWIVYPLLFLAIGLGLRSGIALQGLQNMKLSNGPVQKLQADVIQCNRIESGVASLDLLQCRALNAGAANFDLAHCHTMRVMGPNGKPVVIVAADPKTNAGLIETGTAEGVQQTVLKSDPSGGSLTLFSPDATKFVYLGSDGDVVRLFSAELENGKLIPKSSALVARQQQPSTPKGVEKAEPSPEKPQEESSNSSAEESPPKSN